MLNLRLDPASTRAKLVSHTSTAGLSKDRAVLDPDVVDRAGAILMARLMFLMTVLMFLMAALMFLGTRPAKVMLLVARA